MGEECVRVKFFLTNFSTFKNIPPIVCTDTIFADSGMNYPIEKI